MRSLGGKDPAVDFVNFLNPLRSLGFHVSPSKRVDFPEPLYSWVDVKLFDMFHFNKSS